MSELNKKSSKQINDLRIELEKLRKEEDHILSPEGWDGKGPIVKVT